MMKFQGYISALAAALSLKNAEQLAYLLSPDMTNGQKRQMVMSVDDCSVCRFGTPTSLPTRCLVLIGTEGVNAAIQRRNHGSMG